MLADFREALETCAARFGGLIASSTPPNARSVMSRPATPRVVQHLAYAPGSIPVTREDAAGIREGIEQDQ